jgi:hypothetical protein
MRTIVKNEEILYEKMGWLLKRIAIDEEAGLNFDELKAALVESRLDLV